MEVISRFSGIEVFMQAPLQIIILLFDHSQTTTTRYGQGFNMVFKQESPAHALALSIFWSLVSCAYTHTQSIVTEKGFSEMKTWIIIFTWGLFATLRRVFSIVTLFVPSLGLFSLLHHWKYEQIPFKIRLDYAKLLTIKPDDQIYLYGLNETLKWSDIDRWDYTLNPTPPPYSMYTLLTLKQTFIAFIFLSLIQFLVIFVVKMYTSRDFRNACYKTNMLIHVFENLNFASPFEDWDKSNIKSTILLLKERYLALKKEMIATFTVNGVFILLFLVPLWYTGES